MLAVILAGLDVHGILSFHVARRRREVARQAIRVDPMNSLRSA